MKSSERLVRALILLYPRRFRERYGEAMVAFQRERARGHMGVRDQLRVIADHVRSAAAEHVRARTAGVHTTPSGTTLAALTQDVRHAFRALARRGVFTVVVVLTIALGVGANTAIFSVVHAVLLRPLPYPDADRVVHFGHAPPTWLASQPEYVDYRSGLGSFESLAAYQPGEGNLATAEEPERVALASVTPEFFTVLGVPPLLGRGFAPEDDLSAPATVALLSYGLWQRGFAGDRAVVGKTIVLNGRPRTVIGVMPRDFDFPTSHTDLWLPLARINPDSLGDRANHYLFLVGRLQRGVSLEQALTEAKTFARGMMAANISRYDPNQPLVPELVHVREKLIGDTRPYLWALFGAVGFVLLIVCVNVANLLLARGEGRRREMAVRAALGAARTRLVTTLLAESLVLALAGGALGVLIAWGATSALTAVAPAEIPRLDEIGVDWRVLSYALATSLIAGLAFGLGPALRAARAAPAHAMKEGGRTPQQGSSGRARRALVVAEVALAVIMLGGAGMLLRSLVNLQRTDMGFDSESVLTAKVSPLGSRYDEARTTIFYNQLLARVRALRGVRVASAAGWLPVVGAGGMWGILAEGQSYDMLPQGPVAVPQQVTPDYFAAMGMTLRAGRDFTEHDREHGPYVAIVSESLARLLWPNQDPLGKRFRLGGGETFMTVIGVVGDIRARGFTDSPEPTMYFPHAQTHRSGYFMPRTLSLVVRTTADPLRIANDVRAIVRALDPAAPVSDVRTLEQVVGTSVASRRFSTALIAAFAALALLLAGIGIYGVISYGVSERTFEIGVRMALGAEPGNALGLVVSDSVRLATLGIALGLAGAAVVARTIQSLLFEVSAFDLPTLLAVSALLIGVVVIATVFPARRAMAVSPTEALRGM